ncbi:Hypothetical predicted protein [Mytilus galloprovincialis]|uniref:C-type lectin domain-containing protein n=1 Tax=Mytilus galloprovincialis TaxID=29158 RepID=A0A8B6HCZ8_MYTGA|nr:Hypothetical predicted protein [Mytilus galloprovincialis]
MMKCCCFIVLIFCTIDVSNGGILSGMCHASNGTCGKKGVPCNQTFGSEWTYTGKCCNERPCCKFLKPPCVPETCPEGYRLLPNQASSTNCYLYRDSSKIHWESAQSICASTPGANLWNPNTEQEANNVIPGIYCIPLDILSLYGLVQMIETGMGPIHFTKKMVHFQKNLSHLEQLVLTGPMCRYSIAYLNVRGIGRIGKKFILKVTYASINEEFVRREDVCHCST